MGRARINTEPGGAEKDFEGHLPASEDERLLVQRCLEHDRQALGRLAVTYAAAIRAGSRKAKSFAMSAVSCSVEDLMQEFLADLVGRPATILAGFDRCRGALAPWLTVASLRHATRALRSARWCAPLGRRVPLREKLRSDCHESAAAGSDGTRLLELDRAVDELSDASKYAVRAHYGIRPFSEPIPDPAIAETMGWSVRTLRRRLGTALVRLRRVLRHLRFR